MGTVRASVADGLEEFVRAGGLWDPDACGQEIARLEAESAETNDPLPARLGRFLRSVQLRMRVGDVPSSLRVEIEAIVYPRIWKVIEGIRDGMPDAELQTRLEVMNRRLARLFVDETARS
jgi:hypothetical protein